ncbi:hypothetical protein Bca4012_092390 [Brassica carinata]
MATVVITFFCHYISLAKGMGMESWSRPVPNITKFEAKSLQKPWAASEIQYGQNKGKLYNGECDEFMELARRCNTLIRLIEKEIQELNGREKSPSRIVKHALFEQARKNMCSSRYNSLLLESFSQIVSYGKSFQRKGSTRSLALQQISSLKRLK